jgi:hypothetical protein
MKTLHVMAVTQYSSIPVEEIELVGELKEVPR